jgi:hypothetical protein
MTISLERKKIYKKKILRYVVVNKIKTLRKCKLAIVEQKQILNKTKQQLNMPIK